MKTFTRKAFTKSQDRRLLDLWSRGATAKEIAKILHRSSDVVRGRIFYLRNVKHIEIPTHRNGPQNTWTPEEEATIRSMWTKEYIVRDIAVRLGRSLPSTIMHARQMGLGRKPYHGEDMVTRRMNVINFLLEHGFKQVDIRALLDVSRQRVSQLAAKAQRHALAEGNGNK